MPKVKLSLFSQLNNYESEFVPEVFSTYCKILFCKMCTVKVGTTKRFIITRHLSTEKHEKSVSESGKKKQINPNHKNNNSY